MPQHVSRPAYRKRSWTGPDGKPRQSWQLDFFIVTDGRRSRHRQSFPTRTDAVAFYTQVADEVRQGIFGVTAEDEAAATADSMTLGEFVAIYQRDAAGGKRPSSIVREELAAKHLLDELGAATPLAALTPRHFDQFKAARLALGRSEATVARELSAIRTMFRRAVRWGYVIADPTEGIKKPRIPEGDVVFLEHHEQIALLTAAQKLDTATRHNSRSDAPYLFPLITLALHSGLRRAELFNLRWGQIDFERREIFVKNTESFRTKSGRNRVVGLSADAAEALLAWRAWFGEEIARARQRAADTSLVPKLRRDAANRLDMLLLRDPRPDRLVFPSFRTTTTEGEAAPLDNIRKSWGSLLREAFGVVPEGQPETSKHREIPARLRIGLHALRHTFAVMLARRGVPLVKIKAAMGHSNITTTQIYLRFAPDEGRDVVDQLPSLRVDATPARIVSM